MDQLMMLANRRGLKDCIGMQVLQVYSRSSSAGDHWKREFSHLHIKQRIHVSVL